MKLFKTCVVRMLEHLVCFNVYGVGPAGESKYKDLVKW